MLERTVVCKSGGGFRIFLLAGVFALIALGCGAAPEQANDSGNDLFDAKDYSAATEAYRQAQELEPDAGEPYYNAGNALYRSEDYGGAIREYDEAIKRAEDPVLRADTQFNRGNAYFKLESYPNAVDAFKEALRLEPDDEETRRNLELAMRMLPTREPQQGEEQGQEPDESQEPGPQDQAQEPQPNDQGQQEDAPQEDGQEQDGEAEEDAPQEDGQEQDGQPDQQQAQSSPQTEPITVEQARELLETLGEDTQTLQERLQQIMVDPRGSQSEFDW